MPVLRIGNAWRVRAAELQEFLGLEPTIDQVRALTGREKAYRPTWVERGNDAGGLHVRILVDEDDSGQLVVKEVRVSGPAITPSHLRSVPLATMLRQFELRSSDLSPERLPLLPRRVRDGPTPREFARLLARHYRYHAARTSAPNKAIAEAHSVPVPTVARWVREARVLGELPCGRHGRVG